MAQHSVIRFIRYINFTDILRRMPDESAKVLLAMLVHLDDQWECWPGAEKLAARTGKSERSISRALTALTEMGFAVRTQQNGRKVITEFKGLDSPAEKKLHGKGWLKYASGSSFLSTQGSQKRRGRVDRNGVRTSTSELDHLSSSNKSDAKDPPAFTGDAAAAAELLKKTGMWEKAIPEFVGIPAPILKKLIAKWKNTKKPGKELNVGLLKKILREDSPPLIAAANQAAQSKAASEAEKKRENDAHAADTLTTKEIEAKGRQRWATMSPAKQEAHVKTLFTKWADNSVRLAAVRKAWNGNRSLPPTEFIALGEKH